MLALFSVFIYELGNGNALFVRIKVKYGWCMLYITFNALSIAVPDPCMIVATLTLLSVPAQHRPATAVDRGELVEQA